MSHAPKVCSHGSLERQCLICELESECLRLKEIIGKQDIEIMRLSKENSASFSQQVSGRIWKLEAITQAAEDLRRHLNYSDQFDVLWKALDELKYIGG